MKNFIFKSTDADFKKMFQLIETIQKNVLYSTHQLDFLRKTILDLVHDKGLQHQVDKYFEETSPQTDSDEQQLVIVTATRRTKVSLPSKRPFSSVYELAKQASKTLGYYEDIKQYDPGYYFERYSYKPRKRLAGYAGQILHGKKKRKFSSVRGQFYQKPRDSFWWNNWYDKYKYRRKGYKHAFVYKRLRRVERVYYQGNISYN